MKRLMIALLAVVLLALPLAAYAQTATPLPFDPLTPTPKPTAAAVGAQAIPQADSALPAEIGLAVGRAELAADRAEVAADQASFALEAANAAVERADSMLNQFQTLEAVVSIIGFALTALLIIGGLVGLNRLSSAGKEVTSLHHELDEQIAEAKASARAEIDAARLEAREEMQAAKAQLDGELARRQQELETLRESAQTIRTEAARARLASALLPLGEQQYKAADLEGAIATYERALELDDRNPVTYYRLGYVYNRIGQFDRALEQLAEALDIDKDFLPAKAAIGYTYRRMAEALPDGDNQRELLFAEAEHRLRDALDQQTTLMDDDGESWWGSLGGLYKRRGQSELAKDAYRRACKVTPHSSYPFINLAALEMKDGNRDAMTRAFQHVERVARAETQAQAGNYYGLADLMTAQLALGKTAEAQDTMLALFDSVPANENTLDLVLDTLRLMQAALGGEAAAPAITQAMQAIQSEQARRSEPSS
ncbi:MAG: tetratricopeptide repeat protein [Anaerolineae bacterium]|nr:tetratricopeptide repeat protein [Anaerolineae bacterium]